MTKTEVFRLAKAKFGNSIQIIENKKALTEEEKTNTKAELKELQRQRDECKQERHTLGNARIALLQAARFVVDVDAAEPSLTQLRAAVVNAERVEELREQLIDLEKQIQLTSGLLLQYRWQISKIESMAGLGACCIVLLSADTLDFLSHRLQAAASQPV